jgi:hypothetical protein
MRTIRKSRSLAKMATGLPLILAFCSATVADPAVHQVSGKLETVDGLRILRVWGDDFQRGYAHGFLLADDILALLNGVLSSKSVLPDPAAWDRQILPVAAERFTLTDRQTAELEAMLQGIRAARAGRGLRIDAIGRDLSRADLEAMNSFADWIRVGCSSFSAWGTLTGNGETITGRNLDYFAIPGLPSSQLMIVHLRPGPGRLSWLTMAWPGLIGAYTAMNEEGVTLSMHDSTNGAAPSDKGKCVPRSIALREAVEQARAAAATDVVTRVLRDAPTLTASNFHLSVPFRGQADPAIVFEYDGNRDRDEGVTLRRAADANHPILMQALLCTNHFRTRATPTPCDRYDTFLKHFTTPRPATAKVDVAEAREAMKAVAVSGTLHTVVFLPNRGELFVSLADGPRNAAETQPVHLRISDLFRQ